MEFINIFTDGTKQVSQYPMAIYNKMIRNIFTFILPVTLINYYPIEYLSGRCNEIFYMLTPLVSCAFIVPSLMIFSIGLRKYKSTGS